MEASLLWSSTSRRQLLFLFLFFSLGEEKSMALQLIVEAPLGGFFQTVFPSLSFFLHRGLGLLWGINPELEELKRKLSKVHAVLHDAERRTTTEPDVSDWMDDLWEVVYDMDDILDEMNTRGLQLEQGAGCQDQVCDLFSTALDEVKGVQFKEVVKSKINSVLDRLEEIVEEANSLRLRRNSIGSRWEVSRTRFRPQTSPFFDESEIYGREKDKEKIIELLFTPERRRRKKNYSVIPIVGVGGVGKTTLAQLVFHDERVRTQFYPRSWACVSDIFDVAKVTKDIIEYSTSNYCPEMSLAALQGRLERMVRGERFLLVLDDIWTVKEWDSMKAPLGHCAEGSIILVTTRSGAVAKAISNRTPYELGVLEYRNCWALFSDKALGEVNTNVDDNFVQIGKRIVRKCKGIPLTVKVLGAMLQGAEQERWEAVLKSELWHLEHDEILPALRLSYYCLYSPLKRCFEYFSLFPTDYKFDEKKIVSMWIGEGLIEAKEGWQLEDIGSQYFDELKRRCLIQKNNKMHDLIHNLACSVSGEFFYRALSGRTTRKPSARARHASIFGNCMDARDYSLLSEAKSLRTLLLFGFHTQCLFGALSEWRLLRVVDLSVARISELPNSIGDLKHMRFLDLSWNRNIRNLPDGICELYCLQYLSFRSCRNLRKLPKSLGNLLYLRYLDLSYTQISSLPKSICKLYSLQVLGLQCCSRLAALPEDIGDLHSLRQLNLEYSNILCVPDSILKATNLQNLDNYLISGDYVKLPPCLGKLTSLQGLGVYPIGKETGFKIGELENMNSLRGSLVITNMENVGSTEEAVMADLKSKKLIKDLAFKWSPLPPKDNDNETNDASLLVRDGEIELKALEALEPHLIGLNYLSFRNYSGDRFPAWFFKNRFLSLTCLDMMGLNKMSRIVDIELPSLVHLVIHECASLMEVSMVAPKLKSLSMVYCQELNVASFALFVSLQDRILVNLIAQLEDLCIDHSQLEHLSQLRTAGRMPAKLLQLKAVGCQNSMTSFPAFRLCNVTSLETLEFMNISAFQLPLHDQESFPSSLRELEISNFPNLTCLPKALHNYTCLKELNVINCPKLMAFAEEGLPTMLTVLSIGNCRSVTYLPKDLYNLTSLESLRIWGCPRLQAREDDRLPPSLQMFYIKHCPKLEQQLQEEGRAAWLVLVSRAEEAGMKSMMLQHSGNVC